MQEQFPASTKGWDQSTPRLWIHHAQKYTECKYDQTPEDKIWCASRQQSSSDCYSDLRVWFLMPHQMKYIFLAEYTGLENSDQFTGPQNSYQL